MKLGLILETMDCLQKDCGKSLEHQILDKCEEILSKFLKMAWYIMNIRFHETEILYIAFILWAT